MIIPIIANALAMTAAIFAVVAVVMAFRAIKLMSELRTWSGRGAYDAAVEATRAGGLHRPERH